MFAGLISFLGGAAFRMFFGGILDIANKIVDHKHEMASLELQSRLDAERHTRDLEKARALHDMGLKKIEVKSDADQALASANAFIEAVKATGIKTGVAWVDAWNASIRPAGASLSLAVWVCSIIAAGVAVDHLVIIENGAAKLAFLTAFDMELISGFLGVFVGDRIMKKQ